MFALRYVHLSSADTLSVTGGKAVLKQLVKKKGIFLARKHHWNHLKTPGYQHVFPWFPLGKLEDSMWFPPKGNVLRSSLRDSLAWKPGGNLGFPSLKPGGNYMEKPRYPRGNIREPQGIPGFPYGNQGNLHGNSRFPKGNIRETTWKPQVSPRLT